MSRSQGISDRLAGDVDFPVRLWRYATEAYESKEASDMKYEGKVRHWCVGGWVSEWVSE